MQLFTIKKAYLPTVEGKEMKQTQNTGIYKNNKSKNPKQALKSLYVTFWHESFKFSTILG